MTTMLARELTFDSRWLGKECKVKVVANRDKDLSLIVSADGRHYKRTMRVPWTVAKMFYYQAILAASSLIFQNRCVIADGEVWLLSKNKDGIITVSCRTAEHYCEGKEIFVGKGKSNKAIQKLVVEAIEEEVPF